MTQRRGLVAALAVAVLVGAAFLHRQGMTSALLSGRTPARHGAILQAMETARKSAAALSDVAKEVRELDSIREHVWSQVSKVEGSERSGVTHSGGAHVAALKALSRADSALMGRLARAAAAEQQLLVRSEEIADGKCDDHHKEKCSGESCCAFWARKGQCASSAEHGAWMNTYCSQSCGKCGAPATNLPAPRPAPARTVAPVHAAEASAAPLAVEAPVAAKAPEHHTAEASFSMVLHGVDGAGKEQLETVLRRAVASLSPQLPRSQIRIERVEPLRHPVRRPLRAEVLATRAAPRVEGALVAPLGERRDIQIRKTGGFGPRRRLFAADSDAGSDAARVTFKVALPRGEGGAALLARVQRELRAAVHEQLRRERGEAVRVALDQRREEHHHGGGAAEAPVGASWERMLAAGDARAAGEEGRGSPTGASQAGLWGSGLAGRESVARSPGAGREAGREAGRALAGQRGRRAARSSLAAAPESVGGEPEVWHPGGAPVGEGVAKDAEMVGLGEPEDQGTGLIKHKTLPWSFRQAVSAAGAVPAAGEVDGNGDDSAAAARAQIVAEKAGWAEEDAEDARARVAVEKEKVIDDARHLKHLMRGIKDEVRLLRLKDEGKLTEEPAAAVDDGQREEVADTSGEERGAEEAPAGAPAGGAPLPPLSDKAQASAGGSLGGAAALQAEHRRQQLQQATVRAIMARAEEQARSTDRALAEAKLLRRQRRGKDAALTAEEAATMAVLNKARRIDAQAEADERRAREAKARLEAARRRAAPAGVPLRAGLGREWAKVQGDMDKERAELQAAGAQFRSLEGGY